jgi:hypothetical protein
MGAHVNILARHEKNAINARIMIGIYIYIIFIVCTVLKYILVLRSNYIVLNASIYIYIYIYIYSSSSLSITSVAPQQL